MYNKHQVNVNHELFFNMYAQDMSAKSTSHTISHSTRVCVKIPFCLCDWVRGISFHRNSTQIIFSPFTSAIHSSLSAKADGPFMLSAQGKNKIAQNVCFHWTNCSIHNKKIHNCDYGQICLSEVHMFLIQSGILRLWTSDLYIYIVYHTQCGWAKWPKPKCSAKMVVTVSV